MAFSLTKPNAKTLQFLIEHEAVAKASKDREEAIKKLGDPPLTKLQEAMMWLQKQTMDRMRRGVEGTNQK